MIRGLIRLFLLAYFLMPIISIALVVLTFVQIRNDVTPVIDSANTAITTATTTLEREVRNLGRNFAPLVRTVNGIRSALQKVVNFLRDVVYALIDAVNGLNLACSIGGTACIPKSLNVTLPTLIDFSFIDNISSSLTNITTQVNGVFTTVGTAVSGYISMIVLALVVIVGWLVLTYILFFVMLYKGLWKST
ncbi:MAG: hypothetical protein R3E39_24235 [Anaerolineae bacterium]